MQALADVYRAKSMFDRVRIPVTGIVENMSYFVGDDGKRYDIFGTAAVSVRQRIWVFH